MTELILLALFLALGWLWWDSMQAREAAVTARLDAAAIARMTDPASYLGASEAFIDRVRAAAAAIR